MADDAVSNRERQLHGTLHIYTFSIYPILEISTLSGMVCLHPTFPLILGILFYAPSLVGLGALVGGCRPLKSVQHATLTLCLFLGQQPGQTANTGTGPTTDLGNNPPMTTIFTIPR
jgi:hypothetical protein